MAPLTLTDGLWEGRDLFEACAVSQLKGVDRDLFRSCHTSGDRSKMNPNTVGSLINTARFFRKSLSVQHQLVETQTGGLVQATVTQHEICSVYETRDVE